VAKPTVPRPTGPPDAAAQAGFARPSRSSSLKAIITSLGGALLNRRDLGFPSDRLFQPWSRALRPRIGSWRRVSRGRGVARGLTGPGPPTSLAPPSIFAPANGNMAAVRPARYQHELADAFSRLGNRPSSCSATRPPRSTGPPIGAPDLRHVPRRPGRSIIALSWCLPAAPESVATIAAGGRAPRGPQRLNRLDGPACPPRRGARRALLLPSRPLWASPFNLLRAARAPCSKNRYVRVASASPRAKPRARRRIARNMEALLSASRVSRPRPVARP